MAGTSLLVAEGTKWPDVVLGDRNGRALERLTRRLATQLRRPVSERRRSGVDVAAPGVAGQLSVGGYDLLVVPKIFRTATADVWSREMPVFLRGCSGLRGSAVIASTPGRFARGNVLASWWARHYAEVLLAALRSDPVLQYAQRTAAMPFQRGRIRWDRQAREWARGSPRLVCRFSAYTADNALNRLLKWAVRRFMAFSADAHALGGLRACADALAATRDDLPVRAELLRLRISPAQAAYRRPLEIARALALARQPTLARGDIPATGVIIDMIVAFESFVHGLVVRAVRQAAAAGQGWRFAGQDTRPLARGPDGEPRFWTRPDDVVWVAGNRAVGVVVDAKYKGIADTSRYRRPTSPDVYQVLAACIARGWKDAIIVSPATSEHDAGRSRWTVSAFGTDVRIHHLKLDLGHMPTPAVLDVLAGRLHDAVSEALV